MDIEFNMEIVQNLYMRTQLIYAYFFESKYIWQINVCIWSLFIYGKDLNLVKWFVKQFVFVRSIAYCHFLEIFEVNNGLYICSYRRWRDMGVLVFVGSSILHLGPEGDMDKCGRLFLHCYDLNLWYVPHVLELHINHGLMGLIF